MSLTEKELKVIALRGQGKTLEEIGKEFGVTRERIRQIEHKANFKLACEKRNLMRKQIEEFIRYIKNNCEIRTYEIGIEDIYLKGTSCVVCYEESPYYEFIKSIVKNDEEVISNNKVISNKYLDEIRAYELIVDKRVYLSYEIDDIANYESYLNMFPMSTQLGCSGILTKEEWEFLKGMINKWERK